MLYKFHGGLVCEGPDGAFPQGSLVLDRTGSLYGVTASGGTADAGTVFRIKP